MVAMWNNYKEGDTLTSKKKKLKVMVVEDDNINCRKVGGGVQKDLTGLTK